MLLQTRGIACQWSLPTQVLCVLLVAGSCAAQCSRSVAPQEQSPKCRQRLALQDVTQDVMTHQCPLPGFCWRKDASQLPGPDKYLREPSDVMMSYFKRQVADFIAGPEFQARVHQRSELPERGIQISAGKRQLIGNTAAIMHILRRQHNCTLPIEVAYKGDDEVDETTRTTLSAAFPPVYWLDLTKQAYPAHHNPDFTMERYEPKIYGLYHTHFQKVLLLDADNLPLRDPSYLFDSPAMQHYGNLFWKDYWSPRVSSTTFVGHDSVYGLVGLNKDAFWEVLSDGQGCVDRVAESGQVVIDRVRHADVLEYLWWLTSFSKELYKHVLGDKDTFGFAFACARKLHEMSFVPLPPGAGFKYNTDTAGGPPTWFFQVMTQYDHLGRPLFVHRTSAKWKDVRVLPQHIDIVTGPLPNRFLMSYMGNKTSEFQLNIPEHTLRPRRVDCTNSDKRFVTANQDNTMWSYIAAPALDVRHGNCPLLPFLQYIALRDLGLPVAKQPQLLEQCRPAYTQMQRLGLFSPPTLSTEATTMQQQPEEQDDEAAGGQGATRRLQQAAAHSHPAELSPAAAAAAAAKAEAARAAAAAAAAAVAADARTPAEAAAAAAAAEAARAAAMAAGAVEPKDGGPVDETPPSKQKPAVALGPGGVSLWPLMDEHALARNCRALVRQQQQQANRPQHRRWLLQQGAIAQTEPAAAGFIASAARGLSQDDDAAVGSTGRRLGPFITAPLDNGREQLGNNSSGGTSSRLGSVLSPGTCSAAEWHVFRYMLREYAEHVSVDSEGWVVADVDCQVAALQLLPLNSREESAAEAARCLKQGAWSAVEELQRRAIPAAVAWLNDNIDGLPMLKDVESG